MATSEPIPVLLCGKIPGHQQACTEIIKPEFEVIKICSTLDDAHATISDFFASSLLSSAIPKPKLIIMGGGYSAEDFSSIYDGIDGAKSVPWVRPALFKPGSNQAPPTQPPPAEKIAGLLRKVLDDHFEDLKGGKGEGEIWWM